jgi:translation initiation factor IF-2
MVAQYPEAKFNLISSSVGNVTENDVIQASHVGAQILAMDVNFTPEIKTLAKKENIQIT